MSLLYLPTEIFQHIMHDAVSDFGIIAPRKLRETSLNCAREFVHDCLSKRDEVWFTKRRAARVLHRNLDVLLSNRLQSSKETNMTLLKKIYCDGHLSGTRTRLAGLWYTAGVRRRALSWLGRISALERHHPNGHRCNQT
jgi:hypothetical protein